jgi:hypothetical protein
MERGIDLSEPTPTGYDPQRAVNYVLAIGIDQYEHWEPLRNAVKDANDFIDVLLRQYQFEPENVFRLFDREATEDNIREKIRAIKRRITTNDNLILYYSGHGHYDPEFDEGHWVPSDARKDRAGRYISNSDIIKWINALDAQHILLVIDSCFSGSLVVRKRSGVLDEHYRSRRIISSGRLEAVSDGQPGYNSPFAEGIITYLKKNTRQALNTTELVQRVKEYVANKANQNPVEGRVQNSADENGEFIFHLKISEADFWAKAQQADSAKAYEDYLAYYPAGKYAAQAERQLDALREDGFWENAKAKDSELGYENYLRKYAGTGKYLEQARQRLDALHARQLERRRWLEQANQQAAEREAVQRDFQQHIRQAEALFQEKKLEPAREQYRQSLQYFMEGFTPSYDYIEEQINLCTNGIAFVQCYEDGKRAMEQGNFRLALQYFNEALKTGDDPRVEDFIKVCRQRLERPAPPPLVEEAPAAAAPLGRAAASPPPAAARRARQAPAPARPRRRAWPWIAGLAALIVLTILIGIGLSDDYEPYVPDEAAGLTTPYGETGSAAAGDATGILGAWQVEDLQSNGISFRQLGNEYQQLLNQMRFGFTFYDNGTVMVSSAEGTEYYAYQISGNLLMLQSFYLFNSGTIDQLTAQRLQITFYSTDVYGNAMPMTLVLRRG